MIHPLTLFILFSSIMAMILLLYHPARIMVSLIMSIYILGRNHLISKKYMGSCLIVIILITLINPIVVNKGITVLFYIGNQPYTLEALLFGFISGMQICMIINWGKIITYYISSMHVSYLLSKSFPTLGLLFSMIIRLIPKFKRQFIEVRQMQKSMLDSTLKANIYTLLTMITWIFETSLVTLQSMNVRKYNANRTHFHLFYFDIQQYLYIILISILDILLIFIRFYTTNFYYYPSLSKLMFNQYDIIYCIVMIILMGLTLKIKKEDV